MIVLTSKLVTPTQISLDFDLHYAILTTLFYSALDLKSDFVTTTSRPQGESEQALLDALTSQLPSLQPCNQLNAVSIKLSEFWFTAPEMCVCPGGCLIWYQNITQDRTKYDYFVSVLDIKTAEEVQGVLVTPPSYPPKEKYSSLKKNLIRAFGKTQAQRGSELFNLNGLGDRKPTALLQKMNS